MRRRAVSVVGFAIAAVVALLAMLVPVVPASASGVSIVSDDFNASALDTGLWSVVDGRGDGSVAMVGAGTGDAHLELSVPAGQSHEPFGVNDSLRVVQDVTDSGDDFEIEVRFDSRPSLRYQMQGLLVEHDADDWLRIEFLGNNGGNTYLYVGETVAGQTSSKIYKKLSPSASNWLRVARVGTTYTVSTSGDGASFTPGGSFDWGVPVTAAGPFVGNDSVDGVSAPAFTARVDYVFDTGAPIADEDGGATAVFHELSTSVVGGGSVDPASGSYAEGSSVELTATADPGWEFVGWSGDASGSSNPLSVEMSQDRAITATFEVDGSDTTPPSIEPITTSWTGGELVVGWTTDELTTGSVEYGPTTGYGQTIASPDLASTHQVSIPGLSPGSTVHLRVGATDASGNSSQSSDVVFEVPAVSGPEIDVWYGHEQTFGSRGVPQEFVNILGNVSDPDGVSGLDYRLGAGPWQTLTIGPDSRRLVAPGDFNADIAIGRLSSGENLVELRAVDGTGDVSTAQVIVTWDPVPTGPVCTIDWDLSDHVTDHVQPVDGLWQVVDGGLRTADVGYDRVAAIGDLSWVDYDLVTTATVHALDESAYDAPYSGQPSLAFVLGWRGHSPRRNKTPQPLWYYYPSGAFAGYDWDTPTDGRLKLSGNEGYPVERDHAFDLQLGVEYSFRLQTITDPGGVRYRMKAWRSGEAEPADWMLEILEDSGPDSGGFLFVAHHIDVTFGDTVVTPLS